MIDNWNALDRIENAERETPFCVCGQPMVPAARNDGIWLECSSLPQIDGGMVRRFVSTFAASGHVRRLLVEPFADVA